MRTGAPPRLRHRRLRSTHRRLASDDIVDCTHRSRCVGAGAARAPTKPRRYIGASQRPRRAVRLDPLHRARPFAVGTALTGGPPHRSQRALLTHWAPTSGHDAQSLFGIRVQCSMLDDFHQPSVVDGIEESTDVRVEYPVLCQNSAL